MNADMVESPGDPKDRGNPRTLSRRLGWTLLMAALIALGAFAQFPLGPVPLSLQTFFVLLAGLVLGPAFGALAAALYLVAGGLGLPVFAGGSSGMAKLFGPTGGFLVAFVPMAAIAGTATGGDSGPLTWRRGLAWGALASVVPFLLGVPWLEAALDIGWQKAFAAGLWPFLPGAGIKLVASIAVYRRLGVREPTPPGQRGG